MKNKDHLSCIWRLGKNKFIKSFSLPLQVLAVGEGIDIGGRFKMPLRGKVKRCGKNTKPTNKINTI